MLLECLMFNYNTTRYNRAVAVTLNPFDGDKVNISREAGKIIPKSTTFQTYMFMLSKSQFKENYELYDIYKGE